MAKKIRESSVDFGPFEEENLFHIEKSPLREILGKGLKSVEFITLKEQKVIFLEAKSSFPNPHNKTSEEEFQKYYDDIGQKLIDSFKIFLPGIMGMWEDAPEIGENLKSIFPIRDYKLEFILVITSEGIREEWLGSPKLELEKELIEYRKIWNMEIKVLTQDLAKAYGLIA